MEALFGDKLLVGNNGEKDTKEVLADKDCVGIYFSAHWCPPCRGFTPKLAQIYKDLVASGKKFEIVFASSDKDQASFDSYYGEQPWTAVPFAKRDIKNKLSSKFKVGGIPTLVLLDGNGNLLTTKGRAAVSDPSAFPWKPPSFAECLGKTFVKADGSKLSDTDMKNKTIGLYFSAHWCPPCRAFTPQLAETYKKVTDAGKPFEVVFVSADKDQSTFDGYLKEMPWCAVPYSDRKSARNLENHFDVGGYPTLIIVDHEGNVINAKGRGALQEDKDGTNFPWHPKPVKSVAGDTSDLNEGPCLIVLCEKDGKDAQEAFYKLLEPLALSGIADAKAKGEDPVITYFLAKSDQGPISQVRKMCASLSGAKMFIINVQKGGYYKTDKEVTVDNVKAFVADFAAGKLEKTSFGK
jgi:nucleoredoxin